MSTANATGQNSSLRQPSDMNNDSLPEALADALGRIVAREREAWRKERELAQAESRQTIAELGRQVAEFRLSLHQLQIADHERVGQRIESVKDGLAGSAGERGEKGEPGLDGKDGSPGERGADGERGDKGADGEKGERGQDGAQGKFVAPKAYEEGKVHYEGGLVFFEGATWCARCDTAQKPPHEDWAPVALKGRDAPVGEVCGLHDEKKFYRKFDLVAFNGCEWRATKDDPGPLPGDGWALSAKQGKRGDKGERGDRGEGGKEGKQGPAGPTVVERKIEGFTLIDTMSDGTIVACDIRPAFELYHGEAR